jgi:hypothetical protein
MSISATLPDRYNCSSTRSQVRSNRGGAGLNAFAKPCAAVILLAALLAPACCLNGAHAHGADIDRFGAICLSRIGLR